MTTNRSVEDYDSWEKEWAQSWAPYETSWGGNTPDGTPYQTGCEIESETFYWDGKKDPSKEISVSFQFMRDLFTPTTVFFFGTLCFLLAFPPLVKATPSDRHSSTGKPLASDTIEVSSRRRAYLSSGLAGDVDLRNQYQALEAQIRNKDMLQEITDRLNRRYEEMQTPTGNDDVDHQVTKLLIRHEQLQQEAVNKGVTPAMLLEVSNVVNQLEQLRGRR
jgi:hypothetical protein